MAKIRQTQVTVQDFEEYLETESDFAFELRCLESITKLGFKCEHGGQYTDPQTNKIRQFDIRAMSSKELLHVFCAIECKNLNPHYPLLMMCVPRGRDESFHDVIIGDPRVHSPFGRDPVGEVPTITEVYPVDFNYTEYRRGQPVAKSCARVGRADTKEALIVSDDSDVYERWSQAIASLSSMVNRATKVATQRGKAIMALAIPFLVVPDGTLWQVEFDETGIRKGPPRPVDRCPFFVNHKYFVGFRASHLEFVTLTGLTKLLPETFKFDETWCPEVVINQWGKLPR